MSQILKAFFVVLCVASLVPTLSANQGEGDFNFGPRPADGVFDPTDIVTIEQQQEIAKPLERILKDEGIDVVVVLVPRISDVPPVHIANSLIERWKKTEINAVVIYVPGEPNFPRIIPGKNIRKLVTPEVLSKSVAAAEKRARAESDDFGKIRAASIEAADIMRYWTGGAILRSESAINERLRRQLEFEKRQRLIKLAALLGVAGLIPIMVLVTLLVTKFRRNRPRHFPMIRKISRLGAPYSGGNNSLSQIK